MADHIILAYYIIYAAAYKTFLDWLCSTLHSFFGKFCHLKKKIYNSELDDRSKHIFPVWLPSCNACEYPLSPIPSKQLIVEFAISNLLR